jgi:UMP-CMP kinase
MFRHILRNGNRLVTASTKSTQRLYSSAAPNQSNKPSVPAMLAVASMGFAAYYTLVQSREGKSK